MSMTARNKRRWQLLGVAMVFALPVLVALGLSALGWQPGTKSHGQAILPQRSFATVDVRMMDDSHYAWRDSEPRMTLIALPGPQCARQCVSTLAVLRNARITLNDKQDRLRLLYLGAPPSDPAAAVVMQAWQQGRDVAQAFAQWRPQQADSVAALLVESNGTALLYYPAGF
ncbi:MAG: hypothetical protein L0H70_02900, partial [Xanthomonadales bacterium]|nr:hypothetical protein [Xanthomonadales bacterium]